MSKATELKIVTIQWLVNNRSNFFIPPVQRNKNKHSPKMKNTIINTILSVWNFVNAITLSTTPTDNIDVIDGQQRISIIMDFIDGLLPISKSKLEDGVEYWSNTAKDVLYFNDLTTKQKTDFLSVELCLQIVNPTKAKGYSIDSLFISLNSASINLNGAEKRHSKYYGDFTTFIDSNYNNEYLRKASITSDNKETNKSLNSLFVTISEQYVTNKLINSTGQGIDSIYNNNRTKTISTTRAKSITDSIGYISKILTAEELRINKKLCKTGIFASMLFVLKQFNDAGLKGCELEIKIALLKLNTDLQAGVLVSATNNGSETKMKRRLITLIQKEFGNSNVLPAIKNKEVIARTVIEYLAAESDTIALYKNQLEKYVINYKAVLKLS